MKKSFRYNPILSVEIVYGNSVIEQGLALSVPEIFRRMVLGEIPDCSGNAEYDDQNSESVDPLNRLGLTLEESLDIQKAAETELTNYMQSKQKEKNENNSSPVVHGEDSSE